MNGCWAEVWTWNERKLDDLYAGKWLIPWCEWLHFRGCVAAWLRGGAISRWRAASGEKPTTLTFGCCLNSLNLRHLREETAKGRRGGHYLGGGNMCLSWEFPKDNDDKHSLNLHGPMFGASCLAQAVEEKLRLFLDIPLSCNSILSSTALQTGKMGWGLTRQPFPLSFKHDKSPTS